MLIQPEGEKQVYGGSNKLRSLKKYLTPFAREEELEPEEPVKEEEKPKEEEKEPTKFYEEVGTNSEISRVKLHLWMTYQTRLKLCWFTSIKNKRISVPLRQK